MWRMWPPRSAAARVAAPRGGEFPLGRPCGKLWPPRSMWPPRSFTSCNSLPPEGANFSWGGPVKNCRFGLARPVAGFTLIELLLVIAIIAIASAGVSFALRDSAQTQLEREGVRLAALLESARARSQASGAPVVWRSTANGFVFDGLPAGALAEGWLSAEVSVAAPSSLVLGPEPITWPQKVRLVARGEGAQGVLVQTDGVRPYSVSAAGLASP